MTRSEAAAGGKGPFALGLLPAALIFMPLVIGPLALLLDQSLRPYVPGRIGGQRELGLTFDNYAELMDRAYLRFLYDTFRVGFVVTALSLLIGFPMADAIVRRLSRGLRKAAIGALVSMLFLSLIVRLYAILMTYGSQGPLAGLAPLVGIPRNSTLQTEMMVVFGLLHVVLPLVVLTLIGTLQNINPRLTDAAMSLGAPSWRAFLAVQAPLAAPGLLSAGIIAYAFCISNLVVPLVLGRGFIVFIANLIYFRFSEINNFPSGAAISILMTIIALTFFYGLMRLAGRDWAATSR